MKPADNPTKTRKARKQPIESESSGGDAVRRTAKDSVVTALDTLCADLLEGRLDARADVSNASGPEREVLDSVNQIVTVLTRPLQTASQYLSRIGKGDIPEPLAAETGIAGAIHNGLNQCAGALSTFSIEIQRMLREHSGGDIDFSMPVGELPGVFGEMAVSVNELAAGHISVKKKAMACVAEFGRGNFEAPLERFPGKNAFIERKSTRLKSSH